MKKKYTLILLSICSYFCSAQSPAQLDPSFNTFGTASFFVPMETLPQISCKHLVQPNGKIVFCSNSIISIGVTEVMITRLNSNGSLDLSFGNSGTFNYSIATGFNLAVGLQLQPDGKIVAAGIFNDGSGINNNEVFLLRVTANGILDASFGSGGISQWNFTPENERVTDLKISGDGRFVISGYIQSSVSDDSCFIIRATANGSLDSSFAVDGLFKYQHNGNQTDLYSLEILPGNAIIAAGSFNSASNYQDVFAIKLDSTGAFDNSFGTTGIYTRDIFNDYDEIHAIKLLSDKSILLAGYSYNGNNDGSLVVKLDSSGNDVTSFGTNGYSSYVFSNTPSRIYDMDIQQNGKIVLAGEYADTVSGLYDFMVLRLLQNGNPDITFNNSLPYVTTDFLAEDDNASSVVIQPDGKILVYGTAIQNPSTQEDSPSLARYYGDATGTFVKDNSFEFGANVYCYPNPFLSNTTLNMYLKESQNVTIVVKDIQNRIIREITQMRLVKGNSKVVINLKDVNAGVYFCNIKSSAGTQTVKLVKN